MPASNRDPRSLQYERRNVAVLVRGCRTTKTQAYLYGMQTQYGVRFSDTLVVKAIELNVSFFKDRL